MVFMDFHKGHKTTFLYTKVLTSIKIFEKIFKPDIQDVRFDELFFI